MTVTGKINGKFQKEIILDTGSAQNLVSKTLVHSYKRVPSNKYRLRTAGNQIISAIGKTSIIVEIGDFKTECTALVLDCMPNSFILGYNFLKNNRAVIDFSTKKIVFKSKEQELGDDLGNRENVDAAYNAENNRESIEDEYIRLGNIEQDRPRIESDKIICASDTIIEPHKTVEVQVCFKNDIFEITTNDDLQTYLFIENVNNSIKKKCTVIGCPKYFNNQLIISLHNRSLQPVKIPEHMTIGIIKKQTNTPKTCFNVVEATKNLQFQINEALTDCQKLELEQLLDEFSDIFADDTRSMGFTHVGEHEILIKEGCKPIKAKPYRVSPKERDIIKTQITEMLENNIIRPSKSPWASPVVLVKKKDGSHRFCADFRKVNDVTIKNSWPIPRMDDILTSLGKNKYFSSLDLFSGYWQIGVKEEHKEITAFITHEGLFEFNVMPFGLCNGPATFQSIADQIFQDLKWKEMMLYLDDIVVFSDSFEEHIIRLRHVFEKLRGANLTLKTTKCKFIENEINLLGYHIDGQGVRTDKSKIKAIQQFPRPTTVTRVQSFLGLCNFYRKFVNNFAAIARPLHEITKKNSFIWKKDQDIAFENLKRALTDAPVLAHFNPELGTEIRVDASRLGLGGILLQELDGKKHPIAYISRSLTPAEKNYTISELEALAVVWSLGYLRHFIYGKPVKIVTDHCALCYLKSCKDPNGKLARWAIKLAEYDYKIYYKSGALHRDADCLSRNPVSVPTPQDEEDAVDIPTYLLQSDEFDVEQLKDEKLKQLIDAIRDPDDINVTAAVRAKSKNFTLIDNVLYRKNFNHNGLDNLLVIPKHLCSEILFSNHNEPLSGHLGVAKTYHRIADRYYWDSLRKDVEKYVRGCPDCQSRKGPTNTKPQGLLQPIRVGQPFDRIGIDLLGPFRTSVKGKTMIVVATDYATRYVETAALRDGKAESVAKFLLDNIINRHGCPRAILSDRGATFRSEIVTSLLRNMGVQTCFTTSYRPSCNGLTERVNKTMADMLSKFVSTDQRDWCQYIGHLTFAYNTAVQDTTKYSPFRLIYGREAVLSTEAQILRTNPYLTIEEMLEKTLAARNIAVENIHNKQTIDKERYDDKHRHVEFKPGDQVKVFTPIRKVGRSDKLLLRWFGPYYILEKKGDVDYLVQMGKTANSKKDIVHVSRIAPYYDPWQVNE